MAEAAAVPASHEAHEHDMLKLGTWLFLASEIMFFGAFISAYIIMRLSGPMDPESGRLAVEVMKAELNVALAAINTLVLILSSLTMALAVSSARRADRRKTLLFLGLTFSLGAVFLTIKYFEYAAKFHHGIFPKTNIMYGFYFTMTGFHGLHVLGGMIALLIFMFLVWKKGWFMGGHRYGNIESMGLYWHFVDVVWIFLFPLLYLI